MLKLQIFLLLFPLLLQAQKKETITREDTVKGFSQAISAYLQALPEQDKIKLDTLFVGKNVDFPPIILPALIHKTPIQIVNSEEADKKLNYRTSLIYVNIIGDVTKNLSHFIFVTFLVVKPDKMIQYLPQHNCNLDLNYNALKKNFSLNTLQIDYPYPLRSK